MPTTVTRYVNTDADAGGDGTTNNLSSGGGTHAYNKLRDAIIAEASDLVALDRVLVFECCGVTKDVPTNDFSGTYVTDSTRHIIIKGNRSHSNGFNPTGILSENYYRINDIRLGSTHDYTHIDGIQFANSAANPGSGVTTAVQNSTSSPGIVLKNCIVVNQNPTSGSIICTLIDGAYAFNNIVYNQARPGFGAGIGLGGSIPGKAYNNTVFGFSMGLRFINSAHTGKNNALFNNTDDVNLLSGAGSSVLAYNASDDLDGTNAVNLSPGGVESDGWNNNFIDYSNGVVIPIITADIVGSGIGSGSDSDVPTTDILGEARSSTTPTIGAFEAGQYLFNADDLIAYESLDDANTVIVVTVSPDDVSQNQELDTTLVFAEPPVSVEILLDSPSLSQDHVLAPSDLSIGQLTREIHVIDVTDIGLDIVVDIATAVHIHVITADDLSPTVGLEPVIGFAEDSNLTPVQILLSSPTSKREFLIHLRPFKLDS